MKYFKVFLFLCVSSVSVVLAKEKELCPGSTFQSAIPPAVKTQSYPTQEPQVSFVPWYTGALLTSGAHNTPAGTYAIQPILFVRNTFATFDEHYHSKSIPNTLTIQPIITFQMGWLPWLDFSAAIQCLYKKQSHKEAFYWGDTSLKWGFQLMKEEEKSPAIKLTLTESIPTGKYEQLNPSRNGIDATGSGSYITNLSLNVSKLFRILPFHPFSCKASFNYAIPSSVHVREFNAYGGGIGTKGWVKIGHVIAIDTAIEFSLTQQWALAIDLTYSHQSRSTFSGNRGQTLTNKPAFVGTPSNESLNTALALEYNQSDRLGFLAGIWLPIIGRNSANFFSYACTMCYSW